MIHKTPFSRRRAKTRPWAQFSGLIYLIFCKKNFWSECVHHSDTVRFYPKHTVIATIHREIFTRKSWKLSILPEILPLKFIQITNFEPSFFGQNTKKRSGKILIQFGQITKVFTFFEFGQNTNWKIEIGQNTNSVFKVRARYIDTIFFALCSGLSIPEIIFSKTVKTVTRERFRN